MIASFDVGEKNLAYVVGNDKVVLEMKHIDIKKKKPQTIAESCEYISDILRERNWNDCSHILIEQQVKSNVRAQRIAQHLWTWFRVSYPNMSTKFVSATLKTSDGGTMTYARRKKWAVTETIRLLRNDEKTLEYIKSLPKCDDVSDAYLQMIAWLKRSVD